MCVPGRELSQTHRHTPKLITQRDPSVRLNGKSILRFVKLLQNRDAPEAFLSDQHDSHELISVISDTESFIAGWPLACVPGLHAGNLLHFASREKLT